MRIEFRAFPGQTDAHDDAGVLLPPAVKHHLSKELSALDKSLSHYDKLWKGKEYRIVFKLAISKEIHAVIVKNAVGLHERGEVHFLVEIPFALFSAPEERVLHLLRGVEEGILCAFERYKTDAGGVPLVFEQLRHLMEKNPERYQGLIPIAKRVPLKLSEILQAFKIMGMPEDDVLFAIGNQFDLYQAPSDDAQASLRKDMICYADEPMRASDEDEDIYPEFALRKQLELCCSGAIFVDVLYMVFDVMEDPGIELLLDALDAYLKHDFLDVEALVSHQSLSCQ